MSRKNYKEVPTPWTKELVERLHKYIEASRYYYVTYEGHYIHGMDLVPEAHAADYPPQDAEFYLEKYDDARPDGVLLADCQPTDFKVFLRQPIVDWKEHDPVIDMSIIEHLD